MPEIIKDAVETVAFGADADLRRAVADIVADVEARGTAAVRELSHRFDGWNPDDFRLSDAAIERVVASVDPSTIADIEFAQSQIRRFAEAQLETMGPLEIETLPA